MKSNDVKVALAFKDSDKNITGYIDRDKLQEDIINYCESGGEWCITLRNFNVRTVVFMSNLIAIDIVEDIYEDKGKDEEI